MPGIILGIAYNELEQYEKAIYCYETAVKYKPDYHNAWNNMGIAYNELEQYEKSYLLLRNSSKV